MKIAFLKPPIGGIIGLEMITFVEPLGLECIAGGLESAGHDCRIIDLRIEGSESGLAKATAFEPEIVGLQCNFTTERFRTIRLVRRVKELMPQALVIVGGHDASRDPEWFMAEGIDLVVIGDGEEVMPQLAEAMEKGADWKTVRGLMINAKHGVFKTETAPARACIDDLPHPARHLIKDYRKEYYINFRKPLALLETARGCPYRCNFCSVWKFHDKKFREKSPERVVQELHGIDAESIFITDDIFWMNQKRGFELARQIQAAGIKKHYTLQTRTDIICKFPELIESWKGCGEMSIFLGLEKIDDEGLASVNKKNVAENNERALDILKDLGVGYTPNFIVDPSWGRAEFDKLKRWIDKTGAYNSGFSVLTPLPGTDLWDEVKGDVNTEDWELFDITHSVLPTKLPLQEFYAEYAGLWRHAVDVRYKIKGRMKTHLALVLALATGRVSVKALRKGMRMGSVLGHSKSFLRAHGDSDKRLQEFADLLESSDADAA